MQRRITRYFSYFYSLLIFSGSLQAMDTELSEIVIPVSDQNEGFENSIDEEAAITSSQSFENSSDQDLCSICRDAFDNDSRLETLSCNHQFYRNCIDQWALTRADCPICRANFPVPPRVRIHARVDRIRRSIRGDVICGAVFCTFLVALAVVPIALFARPID